LVAKSSVSAQGVRLQRGEFVCTCALRVSAPHVFRRRLHHLSTRHVASLRGRSTGVRALEQQRVDSVVQQLHCLLRSSRHASCTTAVELALSQLGVRQCNAAGCLLLLLLLIGSRVRRPLAWFADAC
jgi:hypothetical protein